MTAPRNAPRLCIGCVIVTLLTCLMLMGCETVSPGDLAAPKPQPGTILTYDELQRRLLDQSAVAVERYYADRFEELATLTDAIAATAALLPAATDLPASARTGVQGVAQELAATAKEVTGAARLKDLAAINVGLRKIHNQVRTLPAVKP